jgi:PKHD-type hydroxylase
MEYGSHTDDALMGAPQHRMRTDLAFTLFLSDASTYEGGALALESAVGRQEVKLSAGDAFLYPAGAIHSVTEVTRGVRLAAVGWVESFVRGPARREILYDLSLSRARLAEAGAPRADVLRLDKTISNLLRMWAET